MQNLDLECAKLGRELARVQNGNEQADETVFTRALSVLEEQGPYACFLYLQAREGQVGQEINKRATDSLRQILKSENKCKEPLEFLKELAADLDQLLFARDLLRQAFVYARYHAKAREGGGGGAET